MLANRQPLAAKKWHQSDIVFPIMEHSGCNSPLADMLSPFNNIHVYIKNRVATLSGEPGKNKEFENWPGMSGKHQGIWKLTKKLGEKSGNFWKLTDWLWPS